MNGRVLLCAIAGIDEAYLRESEQFSAIASDIRAGRKRKRQRIAAIGIAAVLCAAVFGAVRLAPPFFRLFAPKLTGDQTPEDPAGTEYTVSSVIYGETTEKGTAGTTVSPTAPADDKVENRTAPAGSDPTEPTSRPDRPAPDAEQPPAETPSATGTAEPTTANLTLSHTEPSTEQPAEPQPGGSPGSVYTKLDVSYSEARERFAHPIVPCYDDDFAGYQVGVVSRNGDVNAEGAFCLSVGYEFVNGTVNLQDQDRLGGSSASALGEAYDYRGRTFYVQSPGDYGESCYRVGYYPTWDSGVAYEAVFDGDADVYAIMDLIISVEI